MTKTIKTTAPGKGDLVVGHKVWAFFPKLPAVPGKIVDVSRSGAEVVMEINRVLVVMGLPRRTSWTWRRSTKTYQPSTDATKPGVGLAIEKLGRSVKGTEGEGQ